MDPETINGAGEYPPDLIEIDTGARLKIRKRFKEYIFHDTFFSARNRLPFFKPSNFPYSEITAVEEIKRGAVSHITFTMEGGTRISLKRITAQDTLKIRSLIGK